MLNSTLYNCLVDNWPGMSYSSTCTRALRAYEARVGVCSLQHARCDPAAAAASCICHPIILICSVLAYLPDEDGLLSILVSHGP